jgi:hypothetical protein
MGQPKPLSVLGEGTQGVDGGGRGIRTAGTRSGFRLWAPPARPLRHQSIDSQGNRLALRKLFQFGKGLDGFAQLPS